MRSNITEFFSRMKNEKVAFIGAGVSHRQLIELFAKKGITVTLRDKRSAEQLGKTFDELTALGVRMVLGENYLADIDDTVIFRTPGMYFNTPELICARKSGIHVTSEMEVFFQLCPCPIYAVTGSDGKTTTTTVISEFLKAEGFNVHLGGNIGRALLPIIEEISFDDRAVVELSSFQLMSMRQSPDVAVVTNISPNHLDVHGTMEEYTDCKKNLLLHQNGFSRTVLNMDNPPTAAFEELVRGECCYFSRQGKPERGAWVDSDGIIQVTFNGNTAAVMDSREIKIPGIHNVENYIAAITAVWGVVSPENIRKVAREFGGVEHRIEFVRELDGVKWYNDSIASSPTRTIAGLNSFNQKLIIIAGGYDKKIPFEPLAPKICEKVKLLILTGHTAEKIETAVRQCDSFNPDTLKIIHADSMKDAVEKARQNAQSGDIVSLSPACASFDAYPNFEARGRHFKELVHSL
ncbi:MAG: UDP-N-acetylmuramoyl-L-alanine--D-glutamate ligase [Oscillospiraceae bacterium]|nr:UDP-N-acetylmuramoyl-L-alanine--D-glutamate ligase [Oscillospiraceae bacterium]